MVANSLDSNSDNGTQGTPISDNLNNQNVQPPSTPAPMQSPDQLGALVSQKIVEALQNPDILKGMKDRRFNQITRQLEEFSPVMERVKEILTPEQKTQFAQIQRDAEIEELKRAVYGGQTQTSATANGNQGSAAFDIEPVLKSLKFPDNDPGLAALKVKHGNNPLEFLKAATELRLSQAMSANPTPATSLSLQNTQQGQDEKSRIEAETQNYVQEMQGAQGKGARFGDAIKDKYRQKGVDVDNINFKFS